MGNGVHIGAVTGNRESVYGCREEQGRHRVRTRITVVDRLSVL